MYELADLHPATLRLDYLLGRKADLNSVAPMALKPVRRNQPPRRHPILLRLLGAVGRAQKAHAGA